jgi:hypothetical protein
MSIQRLSNAGQSGFRYKTLIAGITPVASVPVIGEATAVTYSTASVAFTAPGAYAGATYTATSSPGGLTGTSASSPITVSGLSGETTYTFTVTATNATGTSGPSAASNSITTPAAWAPEGAYDSLATVTVPSGGVASVTFAGIPTGYKHLQIRGVSRATNNALTALFLSINSTVNVVRSHYLYGDGSTAISGHQTANQIGWGTAANSTANVFSVVVIDILDYTNTNKNKVTRSLAGNDLNGSGNLALFSELFDTTAAINAVNLSLEFGNFAQYSSFALYGVK